MLEMPEANLPSLAGVGSLSNHHPSHGIAGLGFAGLGFGSKMDEPPSSYATSDATPDFSAYDGQAFYITDGHVMLSAFILLSALIVPIFKAVAAKYLSRSR